MGFGPTPLIRSQLTERADLCVKRRVRRLAVFGCAAMGRFDPSRSDLGLLVEFQPMPPAQHAASYLGLMEHLQPLLPSGHRSDPGGPV